MNLLFLCIRMYQGYGVSVVVDELSVRLKKLGISVTTGCLETDGSFKRSDVRVIPPAVDPLRQFIKENRIDFVMAHSSPYFELLPALKGNTSIWAWEHGEPSPFFFPDSLFADGETSRHQRSEHKRLHIYPHLDGVIAISDFIRNDIGWLSAPVIYNGCDHVPDLSIKPRQVFPDKRPLRIGTLMRLGKGEGAYKGNAQFFEMVNYFKRKQTSIVFEVMGRGTPEDALEFQNHGVTVILNASDEQRSQFLRSLDVFVSCSLWEGFNLPLVEAQASGTLALAFDTGSHPEVTPFLCKNSRDMCSRLEAYDRDRQLLHLHSQKAYSFVRHRFSWDLSVGQLIQIMAHQRASFLWAGGSISHSHNLILKALYTWKRIGLKGTLKKTLRFVLTRLRNQIRRLT